MLQEMMVTEFLPFSSNIVKSMPYCMSILKQRKRENNESLIKNSDKATAIEITSFLFQRNLWTTLRKKINSKHVQNFIDILQQMKERVRFYRSVYLTSISNFFS